MDIKQFVRSLVSENGTFSPFEIAENKGIIIQMEPLGTIRGYYSKALRTKFIHINCDYPGSWKGTIERLELLADGYLLVGRVFDKEQSSSHHVVSLIKIQAGKIIRLDEYWGEDGPPPAWRRQKRIGRPIV